MGRTSNIQPISPVVFELFLVCSHGINDSMESILDSWKDAACVDGWMASVVAVLEFARVSFGKHLS